MLPAFYNKQKSTLFVIGLKQMNQIDRIHYLVEQLNIASDAYYGGLDEVMSNYEWDKLFDELSVLENETGYILPNSPTHRVSQSVTESFGNKESHEFHALSLAKTKSINDLQAWAENYNIWISWKLDGLTLVLTYDNGTLTKILTRGNGLVGTNITFMKQAIRNIPLRISYKGHMVVRGEAIISYPDFEYINNTLDNDDDKYANPRNLASGTLGLDISKLHIVRERRISFVAFSLVSIDDTILSWGKRMDYLDNLGFRTVDRELTDAESLPEIIAKWTDMVEHRKIDFPVDGLVICYDDTDYAATGSVTGHHATRAGFAFKWQDTVAVTLMDHVEWSCAASSITPVAVFEPVQLEGTTVSRASLCNISEMERLGIGQDGHTTLRIIKANKIIPKCVGVVESDGKFHIPAKCPVCDMQTKISLNPHSGTKTLHCTNEKCPAKHLRRFTRFVSKSGFNIDGLSIQTLLTFVNHGLIKKYADIFYLSKHETKILGIEGFGSKSCKNLFSTIEHRRNVSPINFIYALSIPLIGVDAAKKIIAKIGFNGFLERLDTGIGFEDIDGIGPERSNSILAWYNVRDNRESLNALLNEVVIIDLAPQKIDNSKCSGLTFVITGNVYTFTNRTELKNYIEKRGGVVTGTISSKTDYLINNDINSTSSKNVKAHKMGIPVISEQEFVQRFGDRA